MAKKIGIYGGTFDPIHYAHLILAREAMEQLHLDQIVFVPAGCSPHKLETGTTAAKQRVEMLRAAIADEPRFSIDELELRRPPPSYSIETIEEFKRRDPSADFSYLLGSDNLPRLESWHRIAELRQLVRFVVLERGPTSTNSEFVTVRRLIDISATEIRNRVATQRSIRYFVPPSVEAIIRRHRLYQDPERSLQKN